MLTVLLGPLALLSAAWAGRLVEADGAAPECPAPAAVEERLLPLLPKEGSPLARRARLRREQGQLIVELRDGEGALLLRRTLPPAPCADLAAAAAVVLAAAWQAPRPAVALPPPDLSAPVLRRPAPPPHLPWEIAASAWVSFAGQGADAAPGATLEATLAPRGRRLGGRLSLLGAGPRAEVLGPGRAVWTRLALGGGPRYGLTKGRFVASVHAEGLLALVLVSGDGFSESYTSADVDVGLGGGVRVGVRLGPVTPFVGGSFLGWLRPQRLSVTGLDATGELPRFEALLLCGAAFGRYP